MNRRNFLRAGVGAAAVAVGAPLVALAPLTGSDSHSPCPTLGEWLGRFVEATPANGANYRLSLIVQKNRDGTLWTSIPKLDLADFIGGPPAA